MDYNNEADLGPKQTPKTDLILSDIYKKKDRIQMLIEKATTAASKLQGPDKPKEAEAEAKGEGTTANKTGGFWADAFHVLKSLDVSIDILEGQLRRLTDGL